MRFMTPISQSASPLRTCAFIAALLGASSCTGAGSGTAAPPFTLTQTPFDAVKSASHAPKAANTMSVDMRQYMAATIGGTTTHNKNMLCRSKPHEILCLSSVRANDGEVKIIYFITNGIIDYIAITSFDHSSLPPPGRGSPYYIGVARNVPGGGDTTLRCFSTYTVPCTAPPNSYFIPEGVPYTMSQLPVVSWSTVQSATNPDGTPDNPIGSPMAPIPGALITTVNAQDGNFWSFGGRNMDNNCAQTSGPEYKSKVLVAYVPNVPFGGMVGSKGGTPIGTQDAIVVDTFGIGSYPRTAERYYYALGLGRVAEGTAQSNGGPPYTLNPTHNTWNVERPVDPSIIDIDQTSQCPAGTYIPLW